MGEPLPNTHTRDKTFAREELFRSGLEQRASSDSRPFVYVCACVRASATRTGRRCAAQGGEPKAARARGPLVLLVPSRRHVVAAQKEERIFPCYSPQPAHLMRVWC